MDNNYQQSDEIQEKILRDENEKKRKKMKISGKSVFELQKIINKKTSTDYTSNERKSNKK